MKLETQLSIAMALSVCGVVLSLIGLGLRLYALLTTP